MSSDRSTKKSKSILAVILLIPLAFIVYFVIAYSSKTLSTDNVLKVTLQAPGTDGTAYTDDSEIDFFVEDVINSAGEIKTEIRDISGEEPVYIICDRTDKSLTYRLYPTLNLSGCMLIGPDNKLYVLDSTSAGELLLYPEFDYLYAQHFLPDLYILGGESKQLVLPVESDWTYLKSDGKEYSYVPDNYATGEEVYQIYKGNENTFVFEPGYESHKYEVTDISYTADNGSQYMITDLSQLDLSFDTMLNVKFTVKWSGLNGAQSYGEAKYDFNVLYDIPAELTLEKTDYKVGDVIVISATHLNESEKFELDTELITSDIVFAMTETDKGVAILPIGLENAAGNYTLTIKSGAGEQSFDITVNALDNSGNWTPVPVGTDDYMSMLTPTKLSEAADVISSVTRERPLEDFILYPNDKLRSPVSGGDILYNFGDTVNIANAEISGNAGNVTVNGTVYGLAEGTQVRAAQAGVVVLAEETDTTGKTVIIYHGSGIFSYYFHLNSVNVEVGYTLTSGEIIGAAGQTGFTDGRTILHFGVSVDGYFVDPAGLIK